MGVDRQGTGVTERILSRMPGNPWQGLQRADGLWASIRQGQRSLLELVSASELELEQTQPVEWDVAIAGATLGVVIGTALAQRGWRVVLLERGELRGREQEWNISRQELQVLVRLGLLTEAELEGAIASQYNPGRVAFHQGIELWIEDVLNLGVDPVTLLEQLKQKFLAAGGKLLENTPFEGATVHPDGLAIQAGGQRLTSRLLLDMMGHFSPIAAQARQGAQPDGICLVVGTCAAGFDQNSSGDLMASFTPIRNQCQYFWEAFPAKDGRTTYLFTYLDAAAERPSLTQLFDDYFTLLPDYQAIDLEQLQFKRALFGCLPCYRNSPLQPGWDRILQVGDSSGTQSPLSFGGFGALLRHLERLVNGLDEALALDCLDRQALGWINGYQPTIAVTWLFQQAMRVGPQQRLAPNQVNEMLSAVFRVMLAAGPGTLKPFLQDVVQFPALAATMLKTGLAAPLTVAKVLPQVGLPTLLGWTGHYAALGAYSLLNWVGQGLRPGIENLPPLARFYGHRWLELMEYGAGLDYDGAAVAGGDGPGKTDPGENSPGNDGPGKG